MTSETQPLINTYWQNLGGTAPAYVALADRADAPVPTVPEMPHRHVSVTHVEHQEARDLVVEKWWQDRDVKNLALGLLLVAAVWGFGESIVFGYFVTTALSFLTIIVLLRAYLSAPEE